MISTSDYYPFGSIKPQRSFSPTEYDYSVNGQEKDDEISGIPGAHTTAMFWEYDTRLGRRWNVDPLTDDFSDLSPYSTFSGNPIFYNDPNGDCPNGDCDEVKTPEGGMVSIPKGGAVNTTEDGVTMSFSSQGMDFWWDPKTKSYSTLGTGIQYDETYEVGPDAEPRYVQAATNSLPYWQKNYPEYHPYVGVNTEESRAGIYGDYEGKIMVLGLSFKEGDYPEVGAIESAVPIWGPGKSAIYDFQDGNYWSGSFNTLVAVSDVFIFKSIVQGAAKGGLKALTKNYKNWSGGWRKFYGKEGFASKGQHLHHWAIRRNG